MRIEIMIDKEQKISQSTLDALESELYRNLRPLYPKTVIRIRKGSSNGVELTDAPRDKRTYFREINYIAAAFQYQKKNYKSA